MSEQRQNLRQPGLPLCRRLLRNGPQAARDQQPYGQDRLDALILSSLQTLSPLHADSNKGVKRNPAVAEERDHIGPGNTMLRL